MTINPYQVDEGRVRDAFDRAATRYDNVAILQKTVADRLIESFEYLKIEPDNILDLGAGTGYGSRQLRKYFKKPLLHQLDLSSAMLHQSREKAPRFFSKERHVCANANNIPFQDDAFDLVFSSLMLQWCMDLDVVLAEVSRVLKPGGLFIFSTFGPDSLRELRESWASVDEAVHVNTFIDMHDIGDAMVRLGLHEPVLNIEHIHLLYGDAKTLMRELKAIGAHNINQGRRKSLTGKQRLLKVLEYYETFRTDEKLPATYEVIYGHAWKTDKSKKQQEENGIQTFSLAKLRENLPSLKKGKP